MNEWQSLDDVPSDVERVRLEWWNKSHLFRSELAPGGWMVRWDGGEDEAWTLEGITGRYLPIDEAPADDPVSPNHYKGFSNGAEVIDITENLTSNGGQAVQYIARSTRLDGNNKGNPVEDLEKSVFFIQREIKRLTGASSDQ